MKKCLILGGAGYLGRAILRQVKQGLLPWDVTVYSRDEMKHMECQWRYPFARYILGDIRDLEHLQAVAMGHDIIIHAAAVKFIDYAELNARECVAVNVGGTSNVIAAAIAAKVKQVVGISTDKAVLPVNIYGSTKMIMERMFAEASFGPTT